MVQEYAAPKNVPEAKATQRLQEALLYIPKVLDIKPSNMSIKVRRQTKGKQQYEKVDRQGKRLSVFENGAHFYVNPTDYLDVGLFLDHRDTRAMIRAESKAKDVLNLFAYTGSVSVHAALGEARSVTTVRYVQYIFRLGKRQFCAQQTQRQLRIYSSELHCLVRKLQSKIRLDIHRPAFVFKLKENGFNMGCAARSCGAFAKSKKLT